MKLYFALFLVFIVAPVVYGCARPRPRPPPETITGYDGDFVVDPRFTMKEGAKWICIDESGECLARFRIHLYLELDFFDMAPEEGDYCACGISMGGDPTLVGESKRAPAPFEQAFVEQVAFITFDVEREEVTSTISTFDLSQDLSTKATLEDILDDPTTLLNHVDGFLGYVTGFDSNDYKILRDDEAIFVRFLVTVVYDTTQSTTTVAPAQVPGCQAAIDANSRCSTNSVGEGELQYPTTLPFPNFAFKVATGSSNTQGQAVGSHPVEFAPGIYAAGECINATQCNYCDIPGEEECFQGYCDLEITGAPPGLCRMCNENSDCDRFSMPNLAADKGGPFTSQCNANKVCTRIYVAEDDDPEDAAPGLSSLF